MDLDYGFKLTTNGRAVLAACAALGTGLIITRVAVGSGSVPFGVDLADVHELYDYVADGSIGERKHEDNRLYLTAQYANNENPQQETFSLSEFMIYALDPETEQETDLVYATLGSYTQPVPAYNAGYPASVFSFPLVFVLSDEIEVSVTAPAGLVTFDDLEEAVRDATRHLGGIVKSIAFQIDPEDWSVGGGGSGYPYYANIEDADINSEHVPDVVLDEASQDVASGFRMCASARSYAGYVQVKAKLLPTASVSGMLYLIGKATAGGEGGGYELPTATNTRLGGIKVGSGLDYTGDGTTSIDGDEVTPMVVEGATAPEADVDEVIDEVFGSES